MKSLQDLVKQISIKNRYARYHEDDSEIIGGTKTNNGSSINIILNTFSVKEHGNKYIIRFYENVLNNAEPTYEEIVLDSLNQVLETILNKIPENEIEKIVGRSQYY